jgi:hypothetical protein
VTRPGPAYTRSAVTAIALAVDAEHDFAGWLAGVLAHVAAAKGSSAALTAGRPGSWEAALVDQLVKGTVGYDDEYLPARAQTRGSPRDLPTGDRHRPTQHPPGAEAMPHQGTPGRRQGGEPREETP